jgi:hypothetical protein
MMAAQQLNGSARRPGQRKPQGQFASIGVTGNAAQKRTLNSNQTTRILSKWRINHEQGPEK